MSIWNQEKNIQSQMNEDAPLVGNLSVYYDRDPLKSRNLVQGGKQAQRGSGRGRNGMALGIKLDSESRGHKLHQHKSSSCNLVTEQ